MLKFPKKKRRSYKRKGKSYALQLWSKAVKLETDGKCALCGGIYRVQSHHIIKRGVKLHAGWFVLNNGIPLCHKCHYQGIHDSYYPRTQVVQEKIVAYLKRKGIDYDALYLECKRPVDIEMAIIILKEYVKKRNIS